HTRSKRDWSSDVCSSDLDRGVEVRLLNTRELGRIRPMDVLGQVNEQSRLVALASCHFVSGYRIDLNAIGQALHQRNILFCIDARSEERRVGKECRARGVE